MTNAKAVISGVGSYVPENRLTNFDLEKIMDTSDEWIMERTGISERRIVGPNETTSDLAYYASINALESARLQPEELDLIIVATETPDHMFPPVAARLQKKLGCANIGAYDVHSTCVGFISSLQIAEQYIKSGKFANILVVGADTLSRIVDYDDRSTAILFSDGAGAFIVSKSEQQDCEGIIYSSIHSDGTYYKDLYVTNVDHQENPTFEKQKIIMNGSKIFKLAVQGMTDSIRQTLATTGSNITDIDWLIPHQANQRIMLAVARNLEMPLEKVVDNIKNYGNNSAATIPLAFDTALKKNKIERGDRLMLTAFGGGLLWGSLYLEF
ncbi:beta-ketoacyl-ACP synthase III [Desertibacillus haloalkaliphilus]|uniref:beta-ketoacyl-ACP synthase III n=1 Tax=Desertibacillus haloalkaliphilus TaxID=1328930 RepID=UPI001C26C7E8|nr:beta-ketoacyl-ACP synthase III [Desertibacillus haloalkaliphilus]MBU8908208.1 ketoacyl-ACP synthase III [Desertibacillus haloalkaliphilus]